MKMYGYTYQIYSGYADYDEDVPSRKLFTTSEARDVFIEQLREKKRESQQLIQRLQEQSHIDQSARQDALKRRGITEEQVQRISLTPVERRSKEESAISREWYAYDNPYEMPEYKEFEKQFDGNPPYHPIEFEVIE
jgi:hypothetical protein